MPVVIGGQEICSGDVLHGDEDGVVIVPESLVPNLRAAVLRVERQETELMEHVRGSDFDLKNTRRMRQGFDRPTCSLERLTRVRGDQPAKGRYDSEDPDR